MGSGPSGAMFSCLLSLTRLPKSLSLETRICFSFRVAMGNSLAFFYRLYFDGSRWLRCVESIRRNIIFLFLCSQLFPLPLLLLFAEIDTFNRVFFVHALCALDTLVGAIWPKGITRRSDKPVENCLATNAKLISMPKGKIVFKVVGQQIARSF